MLLVHHAAILLWKKAVELGFAAVLANYCCAFIVPAALLVPARTRMFLQAMSDRHAG